MLYWRKKKWKKGRKYAPNSRTEVAVVIQPLSCVSLFATPWTAVCQASLSLRACSNSSPLCWWCHPKSHPLSPLSPPALNLSQHQGLFQWVNSLHQVAKVLEFQLQLQHQSFHEYSVLISFRMDWLDLLAVQGTLKSLLQHQNSKASILSHSAFFMVQLSHLHMTTGKTIALTRRTFVGKVMSLLFNTLSRFVMAFLLRS